MAKGKKTNGKSRSIDPTVGPLMEKAYGEDASLCWDRLDNQEPQCGYGTLGVCCRNCYIDVHFCCVV